MTRLSLARRHALKGSTAQGCDSDSAFRNGAKAPHVDGVGVLALKLVSKIDFRAV